MSFRFFRLVDRFSLVQNHFLKKCYSFFIKTLNYLVTINFILNDAFTLIVLEYRLCKTTVLTLEAEDRLLLRIPNGQIVWTQHFSVKAKYSKVE